jgi:hypothetical protein
VSLGDLDLVQDEPQVTGVQVETRAFRGDGMRGRGRDQGHGGDEPGHQQRG